MSGKIELSQVANGVEGFVIDGEAISDSSGFSVSNAGDVNGDGFDDLIVGAPSASLNGKSYVVFGKANGTAVDLNQIAIGVGGFIINGETTDTSSGFAVSNAGDVNGDGLDDLIVGAPSASPNGKSYVVFGKANGTAVDLNQIATGTGGFVIDGETNGDFAGKSVSSAGDVNGDGLDDIIIGAPYASIQGKSYVVFGKVNGTAVNLSQVVFGTGGFVINGESSGNNSGFSVSNAGDVNGDGLDDVIVGDPSSSVNGESYAGKSYVVFGKANGTAVNLSQVVAGTGGFVINGKAVDDNSGFSVSSAGDVNGDGLDDLIVGAPYASSIGKSYVVFGKANNTEVELSQIESGVGGFVISGELIGDAAGFSVSGAGDVNGDGLDDLIVGAPGASPDGRSYAGKSYVVFGKANELEVGLNQIAAGAGGFVINGEGSEDLSGRSVSGAGDVNNDGFADLLIGAASVGDSPGKSYVVFGGNFFSRATQYIQPNHGDLFATEDSQALVGSQRDETFDDAGFNHLAIFAGAGNDRIYISNNTFDKIDGGAGTDTICTSVDFSLASATNVERLYLIDNAIKGTGNGQSNYLLGNNLNNILEGGSGNDTLYGLEGTNTLIGGAGNDIYLIDSASDIIVEAAGGGTDYVYAFVNYFSLESMNHVEVLYLRDTNPNYGKGNNLSNALWGNSQNDTLEGGAGNDELRGEGGADRLIGGTGNDTYFVDDSGDTVIENANSGMDTARSKISFSLVNLPHVERIILEEDSYYYSSYNIDATGNELNNELIGNGGDNVLVGGSGNDTLKGGKGNDTYYLDSTSDFVVEEANGGIDTIHTTFNFSLTNFPHAENLILGANAIQGIGNALNNELTGNSSNNRLEGRDGDDTLTGEDGADTLIGGTGNDSLYGGAGDDTYEVNSALDVVSEEMNAGIDTVQASATFALDSDIENLTLTGTAFIDGTGNALNNNITGNSGNNTLSGGAGNDTLSSGAGNDFLRGQNGNDNLWGEDGNDFLIADLGADKLVGGNGDDTLYTGITIVVVNNGGSRQEYRDRTTLQDTLSGGYGNDIYIADGQWIDGVVDLDSLASHFGISSSQSIVRGVGGTQFLCDEVTGEGIDTLLLKDGSNFDLREIKTSTGQVADIEKLILDAMSPWINFNSELIGNHLDNYIQGSSKNARLKGMEGNDVLTMYNNYNYADTSSENEGFFDGGQGADTMIGGIGHDDYYVDNEGDVVIEEVDSYYEQELGGFGDTVYCYAARYTLNDNVETLIVKDDSGVVGNPNVAAKNIFGNNQANYISVYDFRSLNVTIDAAGGDDLISKESPIAQTFIGGDGDDTLIARANAELTGGSGADRFVVANLQGTTYNYSGYKLENGQLVYGTITSKLTVIQDFSAAEGDMLQLKPHGNVVSSLQDSQFISGAGVNAAQTAAHRVLYDTTTGNLFYDADGSGTQFSVACVTTLSNKAALTSANILM